MRGTHFIHYLLSDFALDRRLFVQRQVAIALGTCFGKVAVAVTDLAMDLAFPTALRALRRTRHVFLALGSERRGRIFFTLRLKQAKLWHLLIKVVSRCGIVFAGDLVDFHFFCFVASGA